MKIDIVPHNPEWSQHFLELKHEIQLLIHPKSAQIEHFGSTAVPGLVAKPVIDILVGISDLTLLPKLVDSLLQSKKYIHYQVFDDEVPNRRLVIRIKDDWQGPTLESVIDITQQIPHEVINQARSAHIHIWQYESADWIRHIAFRDYLIAHPEIRDKYGQLKLSLSQEEWSHGMEYNDAKNDFIKTEEAKALKWWQEKK